MFKESLRSFNEMVANLSKGHGPYRLEKIPASVDDKEQMAGAKNMWFGRSLFLLAVLGLVWGAWHGPDNGTQAWIGVGMFLLAFISIIIWMALSHRIYCSRALLIRAQPLDQEVILEWYKETKHDGNYGDAAPIFYVWDWRLLVEFEHEGERIQATPRAYERRQLPMPREKAEENLPIVKERMLSAIAEDGTVLLRCNPRDPRDCRVMYGDEHYLYSRMSALGLHWRVGRST